MSGQAFLTSEWRFKEEEGKILEDGDLTLPFFDYHQAGQSRKKSKSKSATDRFCCPKELCVKYRP